jgi:hypothetical protein
MKRRGERQSGRRLDCCLFIFHLMKTTFAIYELAILKRGELWTIKS